jgi:hypothetical protein
MEWKQFHDLANNRTEWRLILDTVTMDEATVAATIKALMTMPKPSDLYWALVGAVSELGDLKRAAAEKARKSAQWERAKHSTDADGFEAYGASAEAVLDAMRKMQEDILRRNSGFSGHAGDTFGFSFWPGFKREQQSAGDYFKFRNPTPPPPPKKPGQRDWWVVIGCSQGDNRATINAAYRKRAMAIHTEKLGEEALKELNVAKDLAFKLVLV